MVKVVLMSIHLQLPNHTTSKPNIHFETADSVQVQWNLLQIPVGYEAHGGGDFKGEIAFAGGKAARGYIRDTPTDQITLSLCKP
jgi:hypothetical protein